MSISDTNILELLARNNLVRLSKNAKTKRISRIAYTGNESQWNNAITNGSVTICLAEYSKYQYISMWKSHQSSQTKHTVADTDKGIVNYKKVI